MATKAAPQMNGVPKKPAARAPVRKAAPGTVVRKPGQVPKPIANKAASVAGDASSSGPSSAYAIMAGRIANRVAEMAESITFVER